MKKIVISIIFLLFSKMSEATTYTLTWCKVNPVPPATFISYTICVDSILPKTNDCLGQKYYISAETTIKFDYPDYQDAWIRIKASQQWWTFNPNFQYHYLESEWSNTLHIIKGLTPPAIGGCF